MCLNIFNLVEFKTSNAASGTVAKGSNAPYSSITQNAVIFWWRRFESRVDQYICILYKRITRFSCEYSVILTVLWNWNMHICISISIHSLFSNVFRCTVTLQCTRIYVHMIQMRPQFILCKYILPSFAEVKVLQQQTMLNVHHMHTLVCTVFKWNYEQHLYIHTLILWYRLLKDLRALLNL